MIVGMTPEHAIEVLSNLDPLCEYELSSLLGPQWEPQNYAGVLVNAPALTLAACDDTGAKVIGGFTWSTRPGVASTFLHHVRSEEITPELKRELVFGMRRAIRAIMTPVDGSPWPPIWRVDCWTALGDNALTVRLYNLVGLELDHKFEQYTVDRGPVWLFSKLAAR